MMFQFRKKNQNGDYLVETRIDAEENDNDSRYGPIRITGMPGDVIELRVTNKNQEDATPDTGIDLDQKPVCRNVDPYKYYAALFFWGRKKRE